MSGHEWKPGDVARNRRFGVGVVVARSCHNGTLHVHGQSGYWDTLEGWRPVVVIDPEDRERVADLVELLIDNGWRCTTAHGLRDALREFAEPKPPKCRSSVEFRYGAGPFSTSTCTLDAGHGGMHSAGPFMWGGAA